MPRYVKDVNTGQINEIIDLDDVAAQDRIQFCKKEIERLVLVIAGMTAQLDERRVQLTTLIELSTPPSSLLEEEVP